MASEKELLDFRIKWAKELKKSTKTEDANTSSDAHQQNNVPKEGSTVVSVDTIPNSSKDAKKNDTEVHNNYSIKPIASSSQESDRSEYYPFKILTHFLNEAPKRINRKRKEQQTRTVVPSRSNYFESEAGIEKKKIRSNKIEANELKAKADSTKSERILDLFIADLDEINEIPFFDSSLPREIAIKIFWHLGMNELCACAQVSKSWKSLADDELLWFQIFEKMKHNSSDLNLTNTENWKLRVKYFVEKERILRSNWSERIGRPIQLSFAQGGVLCAVECVGSKIYGGYTACSVRCWDADTGDVHTYKASNTALVLDESTDLGCIQNAVLHISATENVVAASFKHGFVDVWQTNGGVSSIYTIPFNKAGVDTLETVDPNSNSSLVASSQNKTVKIAEVTKNESRLVYDFDMGSKVSKTLWFKSHLQTDHSLILSCVNSVHLCSVRASAYRIDEPGFKELHNVVCAPISCVALRDDFNHLAVGFSLQELHQDQIRVGLYDLLTLKHFFTFLGHTWFVSCMHLPENDSFQMVTGCGDRKVRVFDTRAGSYPMISLPGHSAKVTNIQMDSWKIVSSDEAGFVCLWDQRSMKKLWEVHNRHPVRFCRFQDRMLVIGNIPYDKFVEDEFESVSSLRYRGTIQVYDFLANQQRQGIPDICLSTYNEPEAYDYNIGLTVPYDSL